MNVRGKRIFVGLSGGVDSAVTAALLQRAGAELTGVFIKGWYPEGLPCSWREDRRDAMRVAARLGIPFITLDGSAAYKKSVIDYLISEYGAGRTPNPDIFCNRDVKFGVFFEYAKAHGADFIATGHYAQSTEGRLYRGKDAAKDQSYFLWAIPQDALAQTLFPLGAMEKKETRTLAKRFGLPVADKKDSQGICFLGSISIDEFLRNEIPIAAGTAFTETGEEVGTHEGAVLYTLGERAGLDSTLPGPWYVVAKNLSENTLTVSKDRTVKQVPSTISLTAVHWFKKPEVGERVAAQYRYHGPVIEGTFDATLSHFTPATPLTEVIAPGQSLVLYAGDECIGGGIIS